MKDSELRCSAPHKTVQGWSCRGKLADHIPSGYEIRKEGGPECWRLSCTRCGAEYVVCRTDRAA